MILNLSNSRGLENNFKAESLIIESILPPRINRVKKLKTQSRRDSETQRNFETLRRCVFGSSPSGELFLFLFFAGKKRKETTSLSYLRHFDIIPVIFAGIPSYALHTCLGTVVPNGTFLS